MSFCRSDIDRAIVMTQYDLRGFAHPLGFRMARMNPKNLDAITGNLVYFAMGFGRMTEEEIAEAQKEHIFDYFNSSYEECLAICRSLAGACDLSQKEAIRLIIQDIVKQSDAMKAEVASKKRARSPYLQPLERGNRWGDLVLALAEAFGIDFVSTPDYS